MDLTVLAIPGFFGSMGAEYLWLKKHRDERGPTPGDYEWRDTLVSLGMGQVSLLAPAVTDKLLARLAPGRGRWAKAALGVTVGAAAAVTVADVVRRRRRGPLPEAGVVPGRSPDAATPIAAGGPAAAGPGAPATATTGPDGTGRAAAPTPAATTPAVASAGSSAAPALTTTSAADRAMPLAAGALPAGPAEPAPGIDRLLRRVQESAGVAAIVGAGLTVAGVVAQRTAAERLYERRLLKDRGTGPLAVLGATLAWDFLYYWNHRFSHESRYLWAMHVVHHSSERYNLSTALRQPVLGGLVTGIPYSVMALLGYRPDTIEAARGINLLYQFWIHTEAVPKLPRFDRWFNSPSLHRVHHGSNRQYLDRNHGSILSIWDRLFGTYEEEDERVRYGLTRNIESFNPLVVATHEYRDLLADSARSDNWSDRLGFVLRGPGWSYERKADLAAAAS